VLACGTPGERQQSRAMAAPAHRSADVDEVRIAQPDDDPPIDPRSFQRTLRQARARRRARIEHHRELRRARLRFLVLVLALLFLVVFLALSVWEKIEALFGL
jgi:hypothetical protein